MRRTATRPPTLRRSSALIALALAVVVPFLALDSAAGPADARAHAAAQHRVTTRTVTSKPPAISLGKGFLAFPDAAGQWLQTHPHDSRAPRIAGALGGKPTALWLTGNESFGNLTDAVRMARAADRTMVLTIYNIPLRYDGLSEPSKITPAAYMHWIDRVVAKIGTTRAVIILEPDALWFFDRMPTTQDRMMRMAVLNYAITAFKKQAPRARVYIDAGTSSGSVTPQRMAALLARAGVARSAGFAVNTSSYAPVAAIQGYAQQIRTALRARGMTDPRFVVDTGRNGASTWDYDWCNPPSQRLGTDPRVVSGTGGLDMDLWIKAPGTSDGDCGPAGGGKGTYGGEFIPSVAYSMIGG